MHAPCDPCVRVDVDEAGDERLAVDIDRSRARWDRHLAARANADDPIVAYHDVARRDDLVALHGHDTRATEYHGAAWLVLRYADLDVVTLCLVRRCRPTRRVRAGY